ncbi:hypothetical protein IFR05_009992 [Cadophora sp. M221]|nr:hypothetical protein IFR05_009992 [Cadophora sp. M221]
MGYSGFIGHRGRTTNSPLAKYQHFVSALSIKTIRIIYNTGRWTYTDCEHVHDDGRPECLKHEPYRQIQAGMSESCLAEEMKHEAAKKEREKKEEKEKKKKEKRKKRKRNWKKCVAM